MDAEDEFINRASRRLGDFDGKSENLQAFLDGIALIERGAANFQDAAVLVIKSKLKGNSRRLITNENTIEAIRETLTNRIRVDNSAVISAKLKNLRPENKTPQAYMDEVEKLVESLENAHLARAINADTARELALETAVEAVKTNSQYKDIKQAMNTGNINNVNKLVTTYVNVMNDVKQCSSVNYYRKNRGNFGNNFNHYNGRGRGNQFYRRGGWNNNYQGRRNRGRGNYNNQNQNNGNQNNRNNNANRNNNQRNARFVQGNEGNPQNANLGDN